VRSFAYFAVTLPVVLHVDVPNMRTSHSTCYSYGCPDEHAPKTQNDDFQMSKILPRKCDAAVTPRVDEGV